MIRRRTLIWCGYTRESSCRLFRCYSGFLKRFELGWGWRRWCTLRLILSAFDHTLRRDRIIFGGTYNIPSCIYSSIYLFLSRLGTLRTNLSLVKSVCWLAVRNHGQALWLRRFMLELFINIFNFNIGRFFRHRLAYSLTYVSPLSKLPSISRRKLTWIIVNF